ncbi:MAG: MarR family winged helix-turn-helix transcriptional regulator [Henriciella sp.]|nr:MarR family winged helix-turn-helix transcriptional regulator [Henriciella sp.]
MKRQTEIDNDQFRALYSRPGFLIRRAHQISMAQFLGETAEFDITPSQFGALFVIEKVPGIDQIGLAQLVGFDRSTAALVSSKLETKGLIKSQMSEEDRRRKVLALTAEGKKMLKKLAEPTRRAQEEVLSAFTEKEATTFLRLLNKYVSANNETTRTPIRPKRTQKR